MKELIYGNAVDVVTYLVPLMTIKFVLNYIRQFLFND